MTTHESTASWSLRYAPSLWFTAASWHKQWRKEGEGGGQTRGEKGRETMSFCSGSSEARLVHVSNLDDHPRVHCVVELLVRP